MGIAKTIVRFDLPRVRHSQYLISFDIGPVVETIVGPIRKTQKNFVSKFSTLATKKLTRGT